MAISKEAQFHSKFEKISILFSYINILLSILLVAGMHFSFKASIQWVVFGALCLSTITVIYTALSHKRLENKSIQAQLN